MSSFDVLGDWLVWKLGNGVQIKIGEDPLIGSIDFYQLSLPLLNFLHGKGICYLS